MKNVTVNLTGWPTKTLLDALANPLRHDEDQWLHRLPTSETGAYTGTVLAGAVDATMDELAEFFQRIPASAYGQTQGLVLIADGMKPIAANRIGWMPS